MIIPFESLSAATLRNIVEAFVGREGTDYGAVERSLDEKVHDLMQQLKAGRVLVVYDDATESVNLISAEDYRDT